MFLILHLISCDDNIVLLTLVTNVFLVQVSVSNNGHVWGIDTREKIWYRKGANNQTILGSNWKSISGNLKQVIGYYDVYDLKLHLIKLKLHYHSSPLYEFFFITRYLLDIVVYGVSILNRAYFID